MIAFAERSMGLKRQSLELLEKDKEFRLGLAVAGYLGLSETLMRLKSVERSIKELLEELKEELIAKNLIVYDMYKRDPRLWIDEPPPDGDLELGIGK